jgi:predicted benzoate:H+ symporter BenE
MARAPDAQGCVNRHFITIAYRWIPVHDGTSPVHSLLPSWLTPSFVYPSVLASALPLPAVAMDICGQRPALAALCSVSHLFYRIHRRR